MLVGQRGGNVLAQQPASSGALATVDLAQEASGHASANRACEFEAFAGRRIDRHMACARDPARRVEQDPSGLLRRVEIGQQTARGCKLSARWRAEPVEGRKAETALERTLSGQTVESTFAGRRADSGDGRIGDGLRR